MKAEIIGDECVGFLYTVVEMKDGKIKLGWSGRRNFWNETGWMTLDKVILHEEKEIVRDKIT